MNEIEVKALEWTALREGDEVAESILGTYTITGGSVFFVWFAGQADYEDYALEAPSMEAAKAAAQKDFEARIRSALGERKAEPVDECDHKGPLHFFSWGPCCKKCGEPYPFTAEPASTPPAAAVTVEGEAVAWQWRKKHWGDREKWSDWHMGVGSKQSAAKQPYCDYEYRDLFALSAAPEPVTVEGGGNAVPQTLDEIIENSLRMWYFNYDPSLDHTAARIAMREIIKYVIDVARVSPASPSPVESRDALIERLEAERDAAIAERDAILGSRNLNIAVADGRTEAAERRVAELEIALEPFAKEAGKFDPVENDDHFVTWGTSFTIGDLREARAALSLPENAEDRRNA